MDRTSEGDSAKKTCAVLTMSPFGLGLARIGLIPLRMPIAAALFICLASILAVFSAAQVKTDDALDDLFRSMTAVYTDYRRLADRFPGSDSDLFLVIEGDGLLNRQKLEDIRTLHLELNFADAVAGVTSIFSIREPPNEEGYPPPVFPADLPEGKAYQDLIARAEAHPLIAGRLLSKRGDGERLALLVVALKPGVIRDKGLKASIQEIEDIARQMISPTGLKLGLTGAPVMKLELVEATKRDRVIFNVLGFCVGFLICFVFFRQLRLVVIANVAPAISVFLSLALLAYWNMPLNPLNSTIMPLVMVITFTDGMHLTFSIRHQILQGADIIQAARYAVLRVGPACALASITTSIALLSLMLTDSGLIRDFGMAAAVSTLLAFITVIIVVPTMAVLLLRNVKALSAGSRTSNHVMIWLDDLCAWLAGWIVPRSRMLAVMGLGLVTVFTVAYVDLRPYYRLSDIVPDGGQAAKTLARLDEKLAGVHPLQVMIEWPQDRSLYSEEALTAIAETDHVLQSQKGIGNVWSLAIVRHWLGGPQAVSPHQLKEYMAKLPKHLLERFINLEKRSAVISGYVPDLKANEVMSLAENIERGLKPIRARYPDFAMTVTGLSLLSAERSVDIIGQLNISLLGAVAVVILLIGAAFRSVVVAALSAVPNLFALVATGALLYLFGKNLEYSSVVALTVAFGLAVDDTIHFINRFHLEQSEGHQASNAVKAAITRIGPVLVLTTIVLVFGLAVTGLSDLPPIRMFGGLCIVTLIFALIGDLVFLPAILLSIDRSGLWPRERRARPGA